MSKVPINTCFGIVFALTAFIHSSASAQTSKLADEYQSFTLKAATSVSYGANGVFVGKTLAAGAYACSNALFGDPIVGATKGCYASIPKLAAESGSFTLTSSTNVSYGANGVFNSKTLAAGSYTCSNAVFGDPLSGVVKNCYAPSAATIMTLLTAQSGTFSLTSTTVISYGANSVLVQKSLAAGTYVCGDQLFGDPLVGVVKACYSTSTATAATPSTAQLALVVRQRNAFTLTTATNVVYGAGTQTVQKSLAAGTYQCSDEFFGDPAVGIEKACYVSNASVSAIAPALAPAVATPVASKPAVDPNVLAVAGDVVVNGAVSNAEYQAMAQKMGTDAAIAYRYGPSSSDYGTESQGGLPTYGKRVSQSMRMVSIQNPDGQGRRGCAWEGGWCGNWQVGGALEPYWGDYSSNILNFSYIVDANLQPGQYQKSYAAAVGSIQTLSVGHNTASIEPEASWTNYIDASSDGGAIAADIDKYMGKRGGWGATPLMLEKPVALAKCYGRNDGCASSLAVYADGRIVSVGSSTKNNLLSIKLPAGKVPTAITITNSGEFALVTLWDTNSIKGQIAVLALGAGCQGCTRNNESTWASKKGNWKRVYPGVPSLSNYNYAKLIGFITLPDTLKAPTEISASTGLSENDYKYEETENFFETDLDKEDVRARFDSGSLANSYARAGMAVVISKSEKRAAFIDLRPLFAYYKQQYFTQSQSGFNSMIANRGDRPDQWPYSFEYQTNQVPKVVKVIDFDNRPTAVRIGLEVPYRAFIATQEGKLHVFDLGLGYLNQLGGGSPNDIIERFFVSIGKNPTNIAYVKERPPGPNTAVNAIYPNTPKKELIVTSRGERKIQWVRFDESFLSGTVARTLQESRIIDPIYTEDNSNQGTESYLITVADYNGKSIHNFMYGPMIWHSFSSDKACSSIRLGCPMLNGAPFEYGGSYKIPGKPTHISAFTGT